MAATSLGACANSRLILYLSVLSSLVSNLSSISSKASGLSCAGPAKGDSNIPRVTSAKLMTIANANTITLCASILQTKEVCKPHRDDCSDSH